MKRLLVGIDFGTTTDSVLDSAASLGKRLGCKVLLFHAIEYVPNGYETVPADECDIAQHFDNRLAELCAALKESGVKARALPAKTGPSVEVTLKLAKAEKADAILVGVSNRGALERFFLGSTAEKLVRRSKWPVFLRHPEDPGGDFGTVLCAVDYSPHSEHSLRSAVGLARMLKAELHVLHVSPDPFTYPGLPDITVYHVSTPEPTAKARELMNEFLERVDTEGVVVTPCLRSGAASATIISVCKEKKPGLLVIGKHGRGGILDLVIGGVATDILRDVPCSVLVVGKRELK
jgi:nucleotide-binding universal stress UspA family protein